MGPGPRLKFKIVPGVQLGVYYLRWPYAHSIGINFLKFGIEVGLGKPYTDPDYKD